MKPTLVHLPARPKEPEHVPKLPTEEDLKSLLNDKPMKGCVAVLVNEDGNLSYWMDGLSYPEAFSMMDQMKFNVLLGAHLGVDEDDE